ncbi:MAG: NADH-quinone oxidoreductase subunit J [Bacteroidota bacterium]
MALFDVIFYFFAFIILVSAAGVVFSKKLMYSAFSLLFTFFGVAGIYVLLNADFIAITQIMIYIGGILVLIIFGVMLTTKITGVDIKTGTTGKMEYTLAALVTSVLAVFLIVMYSNVQWFLKEAPEAVSTIDEIGLLLMTDYLIAFEVAAVMLLIAFIGAALIARRK